MAYQGKKLYFLHIPKTAGTSITALLQEIAEESGKKLAGPFLADHINLPENSDWSTSDILIGHLGLTPLKFGYEFFTILRQPIERLYSQYAYITRISGHYHHAMVVSKKMDFLTWLREDEFYNVNFNTQTRYLSTSLDTSEILQRIEPTYYAKRFESSDIGEISLSVALENLKSCEWVGKSEHLSPILNYFEARFGFKQRVIPRRNVNYYTRKEFSLEEIKAAKKLTEFDEELYNSVF